MGASSRTPPTLVLLAAGLGTRFGGPKPLAPVGPEGEPLVLVSLAQAAEAGFTDAVVVVAGATAEPITAVLAAAPVRVRTARQESVGPPRAKPWGTVAATLAAGVEGDLVVVNGDDLYGVAGLRAAFEWSVGPSAADAVIVGYPVGRTLATEGGVSRGVAMVGDGGRLVSLVEHRDVRRDDSDRIRSDRAAELAPDTVVSMNLFGLRAGMRARFVAAVDAFVAAAGDDPGAELGLPDAVGALVAAGAVSVDVVPTDSPWHGVTWPGDVEVVRAALRVEGGR